MRKNKTTAGRVAADGVRLVSRSSRGGMLCGQSFFRQHIAQHSLQGHSMAANPPAGEKAARAMPPSLLVFGSVVVILSSEFY